MKANKAPEKIYIQSFNVSEEDAKFERLLYFDDIWTEKPEPGQESIEYTRTDAFLEKAKVWLENNADNYIWYSDYAENPGDDTCGMNDDFVKDFVNYMKGE